MAVVDLPLPIDPLIVIIDFFIGALYNACMTHALKGPARTIIFVGRPGSGKETQAKLLAEKTGFHVLSTGEKFRELRQHRDALGERIQAEYDAGRLIPDWFADHLTVDALINLAPQAGIIFEGSGRTLQQAQLFHDVTDWLNRPYRVINLIITDDEARRRQLLRSQMGSRPDSDSDEKIKVRLETYQKLTVPAIEFFRATGTMIDIEGEREISVIHDDIMSRFGVA